MSEYGLSDNAVIHITAEINKISGEIANAEDEFYNDEISRLVTSYWVELHKLRVLLVNNRYSYDKDFENTISNDTVCPSHVMEESHDIINHLLVNWRRQFPLKTEQLTRIVNEDVNEDVDEDVNEYTSDDEYEDDVSDDEDEDDVSDYEDEKTYDDAIEADASEDGTSVETKQLDQSEIIKLCNLMNLNLEMVRRSQKELIEELELKVEEFEIMPRLMPNWLNDNYSELINKLKSNIDKINDLQAEYMQVKNNMKQYEHVCRSTIAKVDRSQNEWINILNRIDVIRSKFDELKL